MRSQPKTTRIVIATLYRQVRETRAQWQLSNQMLGRTHDLTQAALGASLQAETALFGVRRAIGAFA